MSPFDSADDRFEKKPVKKNHKKLFIDDEQKDRSKLNKSFKRKKQQLNDDEDWQTWKEEYR